VLSSTRNVRRQARALIAVVAFLSAPAAATAFPSGPIRGAAEFPQGPARAARAMPYLDRGAAITPRDPTLLPVGRTTAPGTAVASDLR
jgi:hypothetical protein